MLVQDIDEINIDFNTIKKQLKTKPNYIFGAGRLGAKIFDILKNKDVFVDGGAFDGKNTIDFINFVPKYKRIYIFEPDNNSMLKTQNALKNYANIEYFSYGLSEKHEVLKCSPLSEPGSSFTSEGTLMCKCVALDSIVQEKNAYIKLDIEGAELAAINGAQRLIKNGSTLAISVYHKPQDIWQIILRINEINPNYKYKLRHYTNSIFDTVLYAIPKELK